MPVEAHVQNNTWDMVQTPPARISFDMRAAWERHPMEEAGPVSVT
jgi:hypothetical protein